MKAIPAIREREQPKSIAYARYEASFTKVNLWT
jgi:hypothetical protein